MPEEDNCITKKDWTYINYRINPFLVHYSFMNHMLPFSQIDHYHELIVAIFFLLLSNSN